MKILIVTGAFPPETSGTAMYVPWVASAMVARGHSVKVLALSTAEKQDDSQWPFLVQRLVREDFSSSTRKEIQEKLIEAAKLADVIYVNGLAPECVKANKISKKPLVLRVIADITWQQAQRAGFTADTAEDFLNRRFSPKIEYGKLQRSWWTKQADRIITPSNFLRHVAIRWGADPSRVEVIYQPPQIPLAVYQECAKRVIARAQKPWQMRAIFAGRLVSWRGLDTVIKVVGGTPEVHLTIIGEGPQRDSLGDLASQLPLANRLTFVGALNRNEINYLIAESDLHISCSTYEGNPQAAIEAIALGVPVLASNSGATPEIVTHGFNGMMVRAGDIQELASALTQFRQSPELRERLKLGCAQSFDLNNTEWTVSETERVLFEAASSVEPVSDRHGDQ